MSPTKPTIVVFSGAFHPASCMDLLLGKLEQAGFPAEAYSLRTVGNPDAVVNDDSQYMRSVIIPHLDEDKDVIFIMHSFAGFAGSAAMSNLSRKSRESRGEKGGIIGVVYLSAFVPSEGVSALDMLGGNWAPWHEEDTGLITPKDPFETFYKDWDEDLAAEMVKTLKGHSVKSMKSVASAIGWKEKDYDGRRAYIRCLEDNALPLVAQDAFVGNSGVDWLVKSLPTSHSPFLSRPDETSKIIQQLADEFQSVN
ncbi:hypothetical protein B0T10DRAFT_516115 [Thelonectria olida]|uniref:AB hydrolase-1 domain-containing protein n=1 Tax=Thelonectria olida TaxID=1576542 RepID=A0A9P8W1I0_9HYPO|nr:hypothetical protein B0T10DRAFT_516115 [Thelonectria olida]